jgi:hypothetical protein
VDLPAPVAPTMATFWPGGIVKSTPRSTHLLADVREPHFVEADLAAHLGQFATAPGASRTSSGSSRMPKMRSAEAMAPWSIV